MAILGAKVRLRNCFGVVKGVVDDLAKVRFRGLVTLIAELY